VPRQPFWYLDGTRTFGDLVQLIEARLHSGKPACFSGFAKEHPDKFLKVCQMLREQCPDVFEMIPPAVQRETRKQRTYVIGRCQIGKTRSTLVLAWLHWHFCGCFSLIAAWKYRTSVDAFKTAVQDSLNEDISKVLAEDGISCLDDAKLHVCDSRTFEYGGELLRRAQVLVMLSRAGNFDNVVTLLSRLADNVHFKERKEFMFGKDPLVLLMDEDDQNTQTAGQNKRKLEITLFQEDQDPLELEDDEDEGDEDTGDFSDDLERVSKAFADSAYHYIGITATLHATAIANAKAEKPPAVQLIELRIPPDYYGFALPGDKAAQEIPVISDVPGDVEIKSSMEPMVENAVADLLKDTPERRIKLGNGKADVNAAVVLIVPRPPSIDNMFEVAGDVLDLALEYAGGKVPLLVATYHGRNSDGNRLFFSGGIDKDQLLRICFELDAVKPRSRNDDSPPGIHLSSTGREYIRLKGSPLKAQDHIMEIFRTCIEKWPEMKFFCAIVAKNRAGRAVSFKCVFSLVHPPH